MAQWVLAISGQIRIYAEEVFCFLARVLEKPFGAHDRSFPRNAAEVAASPRVDACAEEAYERLDVVAFHGFKALP